MSEHLRGDKSNSHLQAAITKQGLQNFEYFVIKFVADKEILIRAEIYRYNFF